MARTAGLASVNVKITGEVRRGYRRTDLVKLRTSRDEAAQTVPAETDPASGTEEREN